MTQDWLVINYRNDFEGNKGEFDYWFRAKYPQWRNDVDTVNFVGEKGGQYCIENFPWTDNRITFREAIEILKKH